MKLGEILIKEFGLKREDLENALEIQKKTGSKLGQILINQGLITEKQLLKALSIQYGIPIFDKENFSVKENGSINLLFDIKELDFLIKNNFVPILFDQKNSELFILTNDPLNSPILSYLHKKLSYKIRLYLADETTLNLYARELAENQASYKTLEEEDIKEIEKLKEIAFEAPVIKYLNQIFTLAVEHRATDIHIEPFGKRFRIRFRVDGILHDVDTLDQKLYLAIVSRIKLLSGLDIAEKRLPQDGKISLRIASTFLDIRVSTIPVVDGESVVLRLLYKERLSFDISTLGLEKDHEENINYISLQPYGMFLITGPTGSGKTTTLYSILSKYNREEKKIITVEDPVEYQLEGINQIQVKPEIGLTFAQALRSILRHDPDIIMVGEIRDRETAEIAVHCALTGHLVLSTLHTNDAPSALFRLLEMGIEDYLLNASIIGVVAQRIIRKICPYCSYEVSPEKIIKFYNLSDLMKKFESILPSDQIKPKRGRGCKNCLHTGYFGRTAIFEIFVYTDDLKEIFVKTKSLEHIRKVLREKYNFRNLREDGFIKVLKGITTPEEVLRVS